jgi:hypothetical protein
MFDSFFFLPACLPFHFQTLQSCVCIAYFAPPFVMLPNPPGLWTLDKVKNSLRAEQVVQREKAAAARYKRQEEKRKDQETQIGKTSTSSLLLVLTLLCCSLQGNRMKQTVMQLGYHKSYFGSCSRGDDSPLPPLPSVFSSFVLFCLVLFSFV